MNKKRTTRRPEASPRKAIATDTAVPEKTVKCVVCGDETPAGASEGLCWVCRRLKISAWRDADTQLSAQE
ncbi:MAG: hypothetical protein K2X35_21685 [Bryobacteraceae bacterium]|nr:hypothetical protein [Bryobacteraceae bacterium]